MEPCPRPRGRLAGPDAAAFFPDRGPRHRSPGPGGRARANPWSWPSRFCTENWPKPAGWRYFPGRADARDWPKSPVAWTRPSGPGKPARRAPWHWQAGPARRKSPPPVRCPGARTPGRKAWPGAHRHSPPGRDIEVRGQLARADSLAGQSRKHRLERHIRDLGLQGQTRWRLARSPGHPSSYTPTGQPKGKGFDRRGPVGGSDRGLHLVRSSPLRAR